MVKVTGQFPRSGRCCEEAADDITAFTAFPVSQPRDDRSSRRCDLEMSLKAFAPSTIRVVRRYSFVTWSYRPSVPRGTDLNDSSMRAPSSLTPHGRLPAISRMI